MSKHRVLIVEDEADIRRFVRMALEKEGMDVFEAATVEQARAETASCRPELVIVDLGLPDDDGKAYIRELRACSAAPVVVLSAREHESEKVAALDAGADDYLVKPFGVPELLARVRAQLRRASLVTADGPPSSLVQFGNVVVDMKNHEISRDGEPVHLTRIQWRLLKVLVRGHGKVLTSRQLLLEVWGNTHTERTHYVRIYMMNLRQKLEDDPTKPKHLLTELQVGYRLAGMETLTMPT
jgi:two-component system KDP operon response regulator KdpE